jgi:Rrf2 family protein
MFQFSSHWGEEAVTLRILALEKGLSLGYLEQLVLIIRRSGLVKSVRGRLGGYQLARNPERIQVEEVVLKLDAPAFVAACADPDSGFNECPGESFAFHACVERGQPKDWSSFRRDHALRSVQRFLARSCRNPSVPH